MNKSSFKQNFHLLKDKMGRHRTKSLFWELRGYGEQETDFEALFTTKDVPHTVATKDGKGVVTLPSLKQIYFSYEHIPGHEYEFAMDVFGSWEHWLILTRASAALRDMFESWRDELSIRMKANAVKQIISIASSDSSSSFGAARYLADEGYKVKKVGRLTKEEKERQIKIDAGIRDTLSSDMERLGLSITVGGKQ